MKYVLFLAVVCCGCGYVGEPLPPSLHLAMPVRDLAAVQRGNKIVITYTMPARTTDGLPIRSKPEADLRVGPADSPFNAGNWANDARRVTANETPVEGFTGKSVAVAVRFPNSRGQDAGWSNFVQLPVAAPVPTPTNVTAAATATGVQLNWAPSTAQHFRIFRKGPSDTDAARLAETTTNTYTDISAEYKKPYAYTVQALAGDAESEISAPVLITPIDTFAPAIPSHLAAIIGTKSIELSWDRNTESDFAYYRVFRDDELLADHQPTPGYSDRTAKSGTKYRYQVSGVDTVNNESGRSASIDVTLP